MKNFLMFLVLSLVLPLVATAQNQDSIYRKNIVIVFDASGSMDDSIGNGDRSAKIVAGKIALKKVIQKIDNETNVGFFVFGQTSNNNPLPLGAFGPNEKARLLKSIDELRAGGGTPLGEYLKKAGDQLLRQRNKQLGYGSYRILVVTDGEATDQSLMQEVAPEIIRRGLRLDVIGVGMTETHQLAKMSTSYRAANDSRALEAALVAVVAETVVNTQVDNEDFRLIEPLNNDQAKVILANLNNVQNHPLLEKPKATEVKISTSNPSTTQAPNANQSMSIGAIIASVVVALIILFFLAIIVSN